MARKISLKELKIPVSMMIGWYLWTSSIFTYFVNTYVA